MIILFIYVLVRVWVWAKSSSVILEHFHRRHKALGQLQLHLKGIYLKKLLGQSEEKTKISILFTFFLPQIRTSTLSFVIYVKNMTWKYDGYNSLWLLIILFSCQRLFEYVKYMYYYWYIVSMAENISKWDLVVDRHFFFLLKKQLISLLHSLLSLTWPMQDTAPA